MSQGRGSLLDGWRCEDVGPTMPAYNSSGGLELFLTGGVDDQHDAAAEDLALGPLVRVGFVSLPEQSCQPAHTSPGSQPR
jgi:hypothetical protein